MEIREISELKKTSDQSCVFIPNFFKNLTTEETIQKQKYYTTKIEHLLNPNCKEEIIWKYKDRLNPLIYEEERRTYEEFAKNVDHYEEKDNNCLLYTSPSPRD